MKLVRKIAVLGIILIVPCLFIAFTPLASQADDFGLLPDGSKVNLSKNCPVCGMRVGGDLGATVTNSFRDSRPVGFAGVAAAVFKDGHVVGFEGARCLFIYSAVPKKFGTKVEDIERRFVTDFHSGKMMDVTKAFLVLGSSVKGPMGYELIPFSTAEQAEKFKSEFAGKRVVQLGTVEFKDVKRKEPAPKEASTAKTAK
jgi:nitrous oxide reductase accessory protein NosL